MKIVLKKFERGGNLLICKPNKHVTTVTCLIYREYVMY